MATVVAAALGGCAGDEPAPTFTNPVYASDAPDPQAIRVGEAWFLFHTNTPAANVPVLTSPDLVTWSPAGDALPALGSWAVGGKTWAPEVLAVAADRYVLYYTAASAATGRQCVGRAVARAPAGPYVDDADAPLVCQAALGGSIDASPFRDSDGSLHLLWKNDGNAVGADTWIWSQPLAPSGETLAGAPARLIKQTEAWEGAVVEGPFLWRRPEGLFLFYAANAYDRSSYAEGYAVCDSPAGPCRKAPENPILASAGRASGPGHASMVEKDGRTWLLYHAWPAGQEGAVDPGRQVWLDEVVWTDGRPVVRGPTDGPQALP
ncbi:hypothetical protein Asi02nite_56200 [Asanoa siamensis]|uniref:Glycosyl hydrolase family 43 n=1 Tax=Asanoa siamensis TaxID=926357 RepID=A0ABQ4CZ19_9ACTN|nr:hypothetical protein Asi02nite_56200 [Asanoa siamensis]